MAAGGQGGTRGQVPCPDYAAQLTPMSAILAVIGNNIDNLGNKKKFMQWYRWGVFGELYGSANETRYALDLPQAVDWIM